MKSVKPIEPDDGPGDQPPSSCGRNAVADFHGDTRTNATHASTNDREAKLAFLGHAPMENRCASWSMPA